MKAYIKITLITFGLVTLLIAQACSKNSLANSKDGELQNYTGLDGCGWVIVLDDGKKLEPTNLFEFDVALEEGNKISVRYKQSKNGASICMVGEVIDIKDITER
ncbi:MAG: hypothetical protein WED10_09375 [Brumimicrobium sp.]